MKNWLFCDGKQKLLEGFCCISMGWVVKVESKKKSAAMKWFPLHKTKVLGGAPDISLGQKYLTTADPFDPNYNTPDQHRDLKKLTCPTKEQWKMKWGTTNTVLTFLSRSLDLWSNASWSHWSCRTECPSSSPCSTKKWMKAKSFIKSKWIGQWW